MEVNRQRITRIGNFCQRPGHQQPSLHRKAAKRSAKVMRRKKRKSKISPRVRIHQRYIIIVSYLKIENGNVKQEQKSDEKSQKPL